MSMEFITTIQKYGFKEGNKKGKIPPQEMLFALVGRRVKVKIDLMEDKIGDALVSSGAITPEQKAKVDALPGGV